MSWSRRIHCHLHLENVDLGNNLLICDTVLFSRDDINEFFKFLRKFR